MSRVRQELSVVQFQVQNRQANASMDALREKAKSLSDAMADVNQKIADLGNVPYDNQTLAGYRQDLKKLKSDLKDVTTAQNELMKGVKAADKLWKAAETGTMEQLSVKEIKAGQRGMKARMLNLNPGSQDDMEMQRLMKIAIAEGEVEVKKFNADVKFLLQTIRDGGNVSIDVLKNAKSELTDLCDITDRGTKEWKDYNAQLTEISEKIKTIAVEDMRSSGQKMLGRAFRGDFATADTKTLNEVIAKLREYQSVIDDPNGKGARHYAAAEMQIKNLQASLDKLKIGFSNADEVIQRFNQHLGESKIETATQQTEKLAQTLDEKLAAATSEFDEDIKREAENVDYWEQQIKEVEQELADMEAELERMEKKHANSSWFRRQTSAYKREGWRIDNLRESIEGREIQMDDGTSFNDGKKAWIQNLKGWKQDAQQRLDYYKQQKAEALGLSEAEEQVVQTEEKLQQTRRMTREELQQGIKILEEEAIAQDRSTVDGQKKWEQLRSVIDQMNQELKESTGEWMKLADAEKLAEQAGENYYLDNSTKGFYASPEEIQKATAALNRQRETLIKTIQAKKANGDATKEEEKKLQDLTKKLRDLKFEEDNVNMSQAKMRRLMEQPAQAVSLDELRAAIKRADGELRRMEGSLDKNSKEYKAFAEQVKQAKNTLKDMEGAAKASASAWEKAVSRLKTYVGLYMGFNIAWQKMTGAASDLLELSDRMGEVRKTTQMTADEVGRLSDNLKKMDVRTPLQELMSISASAGQLGLKSAEDVQGFTEAANKLMIALPEMGREAATEMMRVAIATGEVEKIRKQLQEGTIEGSSATAVAMEKIASTIDRLRASSASTAPEITDFVKRVGAVGAQSGITIDQVAALGSTISSLGMRVEMSATALSRMIPAIRRNAFDVAKAIGMAPEALRQMFDEAGGGMNAMLAIFQHIKDAGMDEDSIEKMLGMGDMAEIMKELNQQGARAGIVFAGLSQNVDELRNQLGTASKAYEENIAIQQEFERMNETTAAKWERLKNAFEEMWVGDGPQQMIGGLIDTLRVLVDLIAGPLNGAFLGLISAFTTFKMGLGAIGWTVLIKPIVEARAHVHSLQTSVLRLAATWRSAWKSMDAATKANWIMAIASALFWLGKQAYEALTKVSELDQALNKLDNETDDAVRHVGRLMTAYNDAGAKVAETTRKHDELEKKTKSLSEEVDKLKESTDKSTEASDALKKKEEELKKIKDELKKATGEMNKANSERSGLISEINSKYSTYLGYMLNEKTAAEQVASAHQLIIAALKEERKQKGLNAIQDSIDKEYADDLKEYTENSQEELDGLARDAQRRIMDQWRRVMTAVSYDADNDRFTLSGVNGVTTGGTYGSEREMKNAMREALKEIIKQEAGGVNNRVKVDTWQGTKYKSLDDYLNDVWGDTMSDDGFGNWAETYIKHERDIMQATHDNQVETNQAHQETIKAAVEDQRSNLQSLQKLSADNQKFTDDQIRQMAQNVNALVAGFDRYGEELSGADDVFGKGNERTLQNAVNNVLANLDKATRARVLRVAQRGKKTGTGNVSTDTTNPWGGNAPAESTDYSTWDVNELVARRNQMDKFKNILKPDTDVKTVLAEDKALMKALQNGLSADWKSVMGWYNQERLKIQQELKSERFSTNLGHWRDDPKTKKRRNPLVESDYALAELDRYYARRKELLEKAREEENMSEELYNREAELLEQEHLKKRSDLRRTFTADNSAEEQAMVKQFREWWKALEKSGDLDEVPWKTVESEWSKATAAQIGRNNLKAQQDLTQLQQITVKHLNQIAKIIDKERPYDGITANLRKNLTEMDILLADMVQDGPTADTAKLMKEQTARLKFLLGEAENAYSLTFDDIKKKAEAQGWGDWIKALEMDEQKKQSLMQNLRNAYDAIQEAIKKESSIIKKQLEIQWNDLLPGSDMSMKGVFDKAISDLGLESDRVRRANSLIGAGTASERVADKLAIKQMQVQLQMQETYFALMQKIGDERVRQLRLSAEANERDAKALREKEKQLRAQGKAEEAEVMALKAQTAERQALQDSFDAEHAQKSLNLAKTKELAEEEKQRVAIANQLEESQNRLYTELKEWADLLTSSIQGVMEASHAGDAEYYNERAKLDLTGKGGPGAGTYIVIDDAGTSDATAHYEYLDERQALERQHEIEQQNAQAEAWKKLWDDINMKMSDQITDWLNASLQDAATRDNTDALIENTRAIYDSMGVETPSGEAKPGQPDVITVQPQPDRPSAPVEPIVISGGSEPVVTQPSTDPENTAATNANTAALNTLTQVISGQPAAGATDMGAAAGGGTTATAEGDVELQKPFFQMTEEETALAMERIQQLWQAYSEGGATALQEMAATLAAQEGIVLPPWQITEEQLAVAMERMGELWQSYAEQGIAAMQQMSDAMEEMPNDIPNPMQVTEEQVETSNENMQIAYQGLMDLSGIATEKVIGDQSKRQKGETETDKKMQASGQSLYAKLTQAANLYGIAYQAMSNDNLSAAQKFEMIALQAAGQAAIAALTANYTKDATSTVTSLPLILAECLKINPIAGSAIFAALTAVIGGLMGVAASKLAKGKAEIAQVTGSSASAGRLATGMLTYAEGNVNEFTDPASLTPGRQYNVDGADGKTYRARYMGKDAKTHITNGPEFHLVGEKGREAIIDAHTTRLMQTDDTGIWQAIQTLYNGGRVSGFSTRRGRGVRAFAEGNLDDFEDISGSGMEGAEGFDDLTAMQASLDRNTAVQEALLERLNQPIVAQNVWTGPEGIPNMVNKYQKEAKRHGVKYL